MNIRTRQLPGEPAIAGAALLIAALFLLAGGSFAATSVAAQTSSEPESTEREAGDLEGTGDVSYEDDEIEVVELINDYRVQNGLEPVMVSDTASLSAKRHSEDMGVYDFFDHTTMDSSYFPSGASLSDRMDASNYAHNTNRSENIAAGGADPETTMRQWINSPAHNENMLRADWTVVGIGYAEVPGSTYTDYWTTNFGAHVDESATEVSEILDSTESEGSEGTSGEEANEGTPGESRDGASADESREDGRDDSESVGEAGEEDGSSLTDGSDREGDTGDDSSSNTTVIEETNETSGDEGASGEDDSSSTDTEGNDSESDRERERDSSGESRDADSNGGSDECDTMAGFEKNPIDDDDFGEDLRERIQAKVDCEMNSSSIVQDADGSDDDGSDSEDDAGEREGDSEDEE